MEPRLATLALLVARDKERTWNSVANWLLEIGDANEALSIASDSDLLSGGDTAHAIDEATRRAKAWESQAIRWLSIVDSDYPAALRSLDNAPPLLFFKGTLADDERSVSVVGSREASSEALSDAKFLGEQLAAHGVPVVSGLARGIDTAAHTATLDAHGRAVAFIATGIDRVYPKESAALTQRVSENGCVYSQFLPGAAPAKHHFIMRNALMAAYSAVTVLVEGGEHSGARAQCRMAIQHGRPVVLSGRVASQTSWGRALRGHPSVRIADSANDLLSYALRALELSTAGSGGLRGLLERA